MPKVHEAADTGPQRLGRGRRVSSSLAEINVVPLVDVMLVLLIIFMVTAPLLNLGVDVELPQANAKPIQQDKEPVIVALMADGSLSLQLQGAAPEAIDEAALLAKLSAFLRQTLVTDPQGAVTIGQELATVETYLDVESVRFGDFVFHLARGELKRGEETIHLTDRERDMLRVLAASPGETVPRMALAGNGGGVNERAVDVQVNRLRRKIERDPANPLFVQTVRGIGYRLVVAP